MENKFNSIALSKTEPDTGSLWMRQVSDKGKDLGFSLWWFTSEGWKKLFDFDTRYNVSTSYNYTASDKPYESKEVYNPENGIVKVDNAYNLYDASRDIGNNANLVTETGLKYHVDYLQSQIDTIQQSISSIDAKISYIEGRL